MRIRGWLVTAVLALPCLALAAGCGMFSSSVQAQPVRQSSVDPLTEAEFDQFAGRVSDKLHSLATQSGATQPLTLGQPQIVVADETWRPSARYFSYALMDGLTDRLGSSVQFGRGATTAVAYRTMLLFGESRSQGKRSVEFVVTDSAGKRELLREAADSSGQFAAPAPAVAAKSAPKAEVTADPAPPARPSGEPRRRPPPAPTHEAAPRATIASHPPTEQPGNTHPTEPVADAQLAAPADGDNSAAASDAAETETRTSSRKPGKIKISMPASELGEHVARSAALYQKSTATGADGRVILLDSDTVERFEVVAQRAQRDARQRFQAHVTIANRDRKPRDAQYRVIFYDEAGAPVSVTQLLTAKFSAGEAKRFSITAGSARAAQYVWLLLED